MALHCIQGRDHQKRVWGGGGGVRGGNSQAAFFLFKLSVREYFSAKSLTRMFCSLGKKFWKVFRQCMIFFSLGYSVSVNFFFFAQFSLA